MYQFRAPQEEESAETEKLEGDKLRKDVSFFPDELYDRLPEVEYLGVEVLGGGFAQGGKAVEVFFRIRPILKELSGEFTYAELVNTAQKMRISLSAMKCYLFRLPEYKLLVKEGDKYKKTYRNRPK